MVHYHPYAAVKGQLLSQQMGMGEVMIKKESQVLALALNTTARQLNIRLYFFKPLFVGKRSNDMGTPCAHSEVKLEK